MSAKDVHLKRLYIGSKPSSRGHTLSDGQVEIDGTAYLDGDVEISGDLTASSGLTVSGVVTAGTKLLGSSTFTDLELTKTVTVSGVLPTDKIFVQATGSSVGANEVLCTSASTGSFTVTRASGQTSSLPFSYLIYRPA